MLIIMINHDRNPHHTFMFVWITGAVLVLIAGMVAYMLHHPQTAHAPGMPLVATTTEPVSGTNAPARVVTLAIGETGTLGDTTFTLKDVTDDSRCPQGVQCVWAGTVRAVLQMGSTTRTYTLGESSATSTLTLTEVNPAPVQGHTIQKNEYRVTFESIVR